MKTDLFDHRILQTWAEHFGRDVSVTGQPGTSIVAREPLAGTGAVHIWNIGAHVFVEADPAHAASLEQFMTELGARSLLTARALQEVWGQDRVGSTGAALIFHLRPGELVGWTPEPPLTLRRLTVEDDDLVQALNAACTPEEADEGYVSAGDEIAYACLDGDRAVSVVSGYRRNGFMDMGSLTHPAYRGRRLAPAALAAASALTFELGLIPQYRCDAHNTASRRVAEVTGYTLYFTNEALTVTG
jgi:RimJ/RimL family protein N-acetyltransferase